MEFFLNLDLFRTYNNIMFQNQSFSYFISRFSCCSVSSTTTYILINLYDQNFKPLGDHLKNCLILMQQFCF